MNTFLLILPLLILSIFILFIIKDNERDKAYEKEIKDFIDSIENAFNEGKTIIGLNSLHSTSIYLSKDRGFNLVKDINGNKIIEGNGFSFLLSNCIVK